MKKFIIKSIFGICFLLSMSAVSQANVTVSISNMTYINGTPIANCGNIDFRTNSTVRLQFSVNASKDDKENSSFK
jgi:hypothetical protein